MRTDTSLLMLEADTDLPARGAAGVVSWVAPSEGVSCWDFCGEFPEGALHVDYFQETIFKGEQQIQLPGIAFALIIFFTQAVEMFSALSTSE